MYARVVVVIQFVRPNIATMCEITQKITNTGFLEEAAIDGSFLLVYTTHMWLDHILWHQSQLLIG